MFWDIFVKLCAEKNVKPNPVARELGISSGAVTKWKKEHTTPNSVTLQKIATYFGVSTKYLLGEETQKSDFELFPSEEIIYMEVIGSVRAGYNGIAQEEHTGEFTPIPACFLKGGEKDNFFVLRVSGNSMYPKLVNGDLVLVKKESSVDSGSIAVILYGDDEATIKTVKYVSGQNWLDLVPANPEYETKHIEGAELRNCRVLGRVVKLIRDL